MTDEFYTITEKDPYGWVSERSIMIHFNEGFLYGDKGGLIIYENDVREYEITWEDINALFKFYDNNALVICFNNNEQIHIKFNIPSKETKNTLYDFIRLHWK